MSRLNKDKHLQIRINETLKKRYEAALQASGISMTDHITTKIHEFVISIEQQKEKPTA